MGSRFRISSKESNVRTTLNSKINKNTSRQSFPKRSSHFSFFRITKSLGSFLHKSVFLGKIEANLGLQGKILDTKNKMKMVALRNR